ncbi:4-(cytidine 5'-diphospho)-2-C-methyl-D-erythritol kinase [Helicobacter suis]|uniref:4-(cytidine 5'-diphospho)-2-C-methyl-D-erythritol kinase n=1 Tax=Helicobacter suis TaxID=104628 RepID=UPI0019670007|nr:4-(cytidine 5'-diphospho)-2-C-methyl-D-erythritol kinase [Helicobacter suis]
MNAFECIAYPKVNIFLKILGLEASYHTLLSRLMLVKTQICDYLFVKRAPFLLKGNFACSLEKNTIYKMLQILKTHLQAKNHPETLELAIEVEKHIPIGAGLGGGSADAGVLLRELNTRLELGLSLQECYQIGAQVGSDVNFFISGFNSAHVFHFGELIESFEEESLEIEILTPEIFCNTAQVYQAFDRLSMPTKAEQDWKTMQSRTLLKHFTRATLNDLYTPAITLYPALKEFEKHLDNTQPYFFSGSGSSFFRLKEVCERADTQ